MAIIGSIIGLIIFDPWTSDPAKSGTATATAYRRDQPRSNAAAAAGARSTSWFHTAHPRAEPIPDPGETGETKGFLNAA